MVHCIASSNNLLCSSTGDWQAPEVHTVEVSQSTEVLGSHAPYRQQVSPGIGVACIEVVCRLGGIVKVTDEDGNSYLPHQPYIRYGLLYKDHLMFYCNNRASVTSIGDTPYYATHSSCTNSPVTDNGQFVFATPRKRPLPQPIPTRTVLHPLHDKQCYVKVGLLACAASTKVSLRVVSNSRLDRGYRNLDHSS